MVKTVAAVGVMLIAFLAGAPIALVAIGGAAYSLFTRRVKPEKVYRDVNWQLLANEPVSLRIWPPGRAPWDFIAQRSSR